MNEVTVLLEAIERGNPQAGEALLPLVYEELRKLAAARMANESPGQTLQPTALVHEAWLRLADGQNRKWDSRAHFFGAAAEAMRRILIERARRKLAAKRGSGQKALDIQDIEIASPGSDEELVAVNESLQRLAELDPPKAELVKLRYFVGLTLQEAATVLGISEPTAKRWWAYSRAWLYADITAMQKAE